MIVDLEIMKQHLSIDNDLTIHDELIKSYIQAAHKHIENELNSKIVTSSEQIYECGSKKVIYFDESLRQAVYLIVTHWFENRGIISVGNNVNKLPMAVDVLLFPYREHFIG